MSVSDMLTTLHAVTIRCMHKNLHVNSSGHLYVTNELTALVVLSARVTEVAALEPLSSNNEGENLLIRGCL